MDKKTVSELVKKLKGSDWLFFSGFAVEIYTEGKRQAGKDIDILVARKDIDEIAKRFDSVAKHRKFKKADFIVDDYAFEAIFRDVEIEITSGFPKKRMEDGTIDNVFKNKEVKNYLGVGLPVEPIEELIAFKASMHRPKDIRDLQLLHKHQFKPNLLIELAKDWGQQKEILEVLKNLGYKISPTKPEKQLF